MDEKLHIYEEATNLFWGLIILVSTTLATFILANSFVTDGWSFSSLNQIVALLLIALSFVGILKISEPLYHFVFSISGQQLIIETHKGKQHIYTDEISLQEIEALTFSPYRPRSPGEALFDFSTNYQLMFKKTSGADYKPLIDPREGSFTLKVEDIGKIMRFLQHHHSAIKIPEEQPYF